jgi:hypothetical protein
VAVRLKDADAKRHKFNMVLVVDLRQSPVKSSSVTSFWTGAIWRSWSSAARRASRHCSRGSVIAPTRPLRSE